MQMALLGSGGSAAELPAGWALAMSFSDNNGGVKAGSGFNVTKHGTPRWESTGGRDNGGSLGQSGRGTTSSDCYQMRSGTTTYPGSLPSFNNGKSACLWYKGTDNDTSGSYTSGTVMFGDTRGSVWGSWGLRNGHPSHDHGSNHYNSNVAVRDGNWHHIAWVYKGDDSKISFYVDGNYTNHQNNPAQSTNMHTDYITGHYAYGNANWPDRIDDVVVYDRELTAAEVSEIYNFGTFDW